MTGVICCEDDVNEEEGESVVEDEGWFADEVVEWNDAVVSLSLVDLPPATNGKYALDNGNQYPQSPQDPASSPANTVIPDLIVPIIRVLHSIVRLLAIPFPQRCRTLSFPFAFPNVHNPPAYPLRSTRIYLALLQHPLNLLHDHPFIPISPGSQDRLVLLPLWRLPWQFGCCCPTADFSPV